MKFFNLKYILISLVVLLFIFSSFSNVIKGERIAVLEINGVIENPKIYLINLEKIKSNKNIKGLIVRVNSPGGTVGSSQEIYNTLKELRPDLPIVASIVDIGASGGYYYDKQRKKLKMLDQVQEWRDESAHAQRDETGNPMHSSQKSATKAHDNL